MKTFMNRRDCSTVGCLFFTLALIGSLMVNRLTADESNPNLLLKPESALATAPINVDAITLATQLDGVPLAYADPQILFQKETEKAQFVAAVWKDASGQLIHQRGVFLLKSEYAVVVDYVYGQGQHSVSRSFTFTDGTVTNNQQVLQDLLPSGANFLVQALDVAGAVPTPSADGKGLTYTLATTLPVPLPTILLPWQGETGPKVEFVKPGNHMIVKLKITFPDGRVDHVGLAWESRAIHLNEQEFNGWAACLQIKPSGTSSLEIK